MVSSLLPFLPSNSCVHISLVFTGKEDRKVLETVLAKVVEDLKTVARDGMCVLVCARGRSVALRATLPLL